MKLTKLILTTTLLYLFFPKADAQFSETIFYDTLTKVSSDGYVNSAITEGKYIYVSGGSFSQSAPLPTITKMDTSGNVIWTATDESNYNRFGNYYGLENFMASCRSTIKSGNRIFTAAEPANFSLSSTRLHELWCVSDSTGLLMWKLNINNNWIVRIADYSDTSIIAITSGGNTLDFFTYNYNYHLINKNTGALIYSKQFGTAGLSLLNEPNLLVDTHKNILLSWDDTCRKFRDDRLNEIVWTSHIPNNGSLKMIDVVIQSDNRYYFSGQNNVRCVDTATGETVWYNQYDAIGFLPGIQGGGNCRPKDILIKDSLIFITWSSVAVGGVGLGRGFTLTRMNKINGHLKYMVAHDFTGTLPDPAPPFTSEIDWPFKICMDHNRNIYMVGSYDRADGVESTGNWGVMRINSESGEKMYEATITNDPSQRTQRSQGKFVYYFDGKLYALGNLEKPATNPLYARPLVVSFDTSSIYHERYRKGIEATVRYPSSLKSILPFSATKMALLKKVGRSAVVELRSNNNQLVWSKTFNSATKFMIPQNITALSDTGIAVSMILHNEDPETRLIPGTGDSLVFVRLDTVGNIKFLHRIKHNDTDTLTGVQVYKDPLGKVNFVFRRKIGPVYNYGAYMLDGTAANLSHIGDNIYYDTDTSIRVNALQHYNADTMVSYQSGNIFSSRGWLKSTTQSSNYSHFGQNLIDDFERINSSLKLDSTSFFVMGRDNNGQIRGARYNHRLTNALVWSYIPGVNGTLLGADSSSQFLYTVSTSMPNKKLIINKISRETGTAVWEVWKNPLVKTNILPTDFKYDLIHRRFTIAGFIVDSSVSGAGTSYFYMTLDSNGTIVKDVVRHSFGLGETKINAIENSQTGTNIYGGSISLSEYGTVGFYNSDCTGNTVMPSVNINSSGNNFCSGTPITFTSTALNGGSYPTYDWKVNGVSVGINTPSFTTNTLTTGAQVHLIMTSNADCLQSTTAVSNQIQVTVISANSASATINGQTTVIQGQATLITVTPDNGGTAPIYQWQDSTSTHGWQNINGAVSSTINYVPTATGNKLRVNMNSNMNCTSTASVISNTLVFTVNTVTSVGPTPASGFGIVFYPNPTTDNLIIDSLRISDKWERIVISSIDGRQVMGSIDVKNKKNVTINVSRVPAGSYVGVLLGKNKASVYFRFQKFY